MLGKPSRIPIVKNIHLCIDNVPLYELLKALIFEWGYRLSDNPEDNPLLILSENRLRPTGFTHALTFSSSHYQDRHQLEIPLTLENFYLALENHFHRTPRNHIRINLEWPIRVKVRNQQFETNTVTISDRGIRFTSPIELAREEEIEIHIERDDEIYDLHAKVVYSLMGKEIGLGPQIQVGTVCVPQTKEVRESIRSRIIGTYLMRVRPVIGNNRFTEALGQLKLTHISETLATSGTLG